MKTSGAARRRGAASVRKRKAGVARERACSVSMEALWLRGRARGGGLRGELRVRLREERAGACIVGDDGEN
ncbi:MAG: hypothetical protein RLZZ15_4206 [Verrucomicrobiota bacterium]